MMSQIRSRRPIRVLLPQSGSELKQWQQRGRGGTDWRNMQSKKQTILVFDWKGKNLGWLTCFGLGEWYMGNKRWKKNELKFCTCLYRYLENILINTSSRQLECVVSGEVSEGNKDLGVSSRQGIVKITAVEQMDRRGSRVRREPRLEFQVILLFKELPKQVSTYRRLRRNVIRSGERTRREQCYET